MLRAILMCGRWGCVTLAAGTVAAGCGDGTTSTGGDAGPMDAAPRTDGGDRPDGEVLLDARAAEAMMRPPEAMMRIRCMKTALAA